MATDNETLSNANTTLTDNVVQLETAAAASAVELEEQSEIANGLCEQKVVATLR